MEKWKGFLAGLCLPFLILSCSAPSGDSQTTPSISGVWSGTYSQTSTLASDTTTPRGPICLEISQNGTNVSGKGWVSGVLWGENFSGTVTGNSFSGTISGKDIGGNNISVSFSGTITSNQISGTVTVSSGSTSATYNISLNKDSAKSNCGWAGRDVALAFGQALGSAISGDPNSPSSDGYIFASFITEVPKVNVKVDVTEYQDWWACVWEIRDKTTSAEQTLGAIISPDLTKITAWKINDGGQDIGLNASDQPASFSNPLAPATGADAFYTDVASTPALLFQADGRGSDDQYFNNGTQLGQPFYVSPCMSGKRYTVYMTELPFYLKFSGTGTDLSSHTFETPPNPSNTNLNNIPSLYIEINSCT